MSYLLAKASRKAPSFFQGFLVTIIDQTRTWNNFWDDCDITWTEDPNQTFVFKLYAALRCVPWSYAQLSITYIYVYIYTHTKSLPDSASFVILLNILEYLHLPHQMLSAPGEGEEIKHHNCREEFKYNRLWCLITWWCW